MKAPTKGPRPGRGDAEAAPGDVRRRGELDFPPEEAETLTGHGSQTLGTSEKFLESDVSVTDKGLAAKSRARVVAAAPVDATSTRASTSTSSSSSSSEYPTGPREEGRRRDTMPVPASGSGIPLPPPIPASARTGIPPLPPARSPSRPDDLPLALGATLDDDSEVEVALGGLRRSKPREDDTQTKLELRRPQAMPSSNEEDAPTSPTLSLAHQSDAAREVYQLFLASKYAPAYALATELIAQGDDDPMLLTIARECRDSIEVRDADRQGPITDRGFWDEPGRSSADAMFPQPVSLRSLNVDENTTIGELSRLTGVSLEELLAVLDRFVALGVLSQRPPS